LIIATTDAAGIPEIPDAATETEWQSYLWLRISPATTSFALYAWNPSQTYNVTYSVGVGSVNTNWNPVTIGSIPANSIQGYQLATATIPADKIQSITVSQVTGFAPANYVAKTDAPVAGYISGNFTTGLVINNGSISTEMFTALSVDTAAIAAKAATAAKVLGGTIGQFLKTTNGTADAGWVTPNDLVAQLDAAVMVAGNGSKVLRVNSGATAYELVAAASVGIILQSLTKTVPATSGTTVMPEDSTIPQRSTEGFEIASQAITIQSASSLIRIRAEVSLSTGAANMAGIAVFKSTAEDALAARATYTGGGATLPNSISIDVVIASPGAGAITFSLKAGCGSAGTVYVNRTSTGATTPYGAANVSFFSVEEILGTLS